MWDKEQCNLHNINNGTYTGDLNLEPRLNAPTLLFLSLSLLCTINTHASGQLGGNSLHSSEALAITTTTTTTTTTKTHLDCYTAEHPQSTFSTLPLSTVLTTSKSSKHPRQKNQPSITTELTYKNPTSLYLTSSLSFHLFVTRSFTLPVNSDSAHHLELFLQSSPITSSLRKALVGSSPYQATITQPPYPPSQATTSVAEKTYHLKVLRAPSSKKLKPSPPIQHIRPAYYQLAQRPEYPPKEQQVLSCSSKREKQGEKEKDRKRKKRKGNKKGKRKRENERKVRKKKEENKKIKRKERKERRKRISIGKKK